MSLIIQRMLCKHHWKQINAVTVACEKCGKIRYIPCCHKWKTYKKVWCNEGWGSRYIMNTLICEHCGQIVKVKDI